VCVLEYAADGIACNSTSLAVPGNVARFWVELIEPVLRAYLEPSEMIEKDRVYSIAADPVRGVGLVAPHP
jgi:hypothetical protein